MPPIVTLTLNPAVDGSAEAEVVRPVRKTRTSNERYDPGGGGINVARVVQELGGSALAVYLGGGATGSVLDELLDAQHPAPPGSDPGPHARQSRRLRTSDRP